MGKALGVVANDAVLFEEIVEHNAIAELLEFRDVDGDLMGALGSVAFGHFGRNQFAIGNDPVYGRAMRICRNNIALDGTKVVGE